MKKLAATLCLTALATAAFAQGTVNSANGSGTLFRTNSIGIGGTSGNTANGAPSAGAATHGGFQYHLLVAPSTVTSVDASLQGLLSGPWSDGGINMTNATLASGGRINGPSGTAGQTQNWPANATESFIVVGWSADEGADWATFRTALLGAHFNGSFWDQGALLQNGGFIGASTIQQLASGDAVGAAPSSLFGSVGPSGTPITTPSTLWVVNVPEPTSMALAGLGLGALVIFRRRKA